MRRLLALLCAFAVVLTPAAAHASPQVQIRSMTFNICGVMCNKGSMAPAQYALRQLRSRSVDVVALQEVCYSQFRYIEDRLPKGYSTAFTASTEVIGTCATYDKRHGKAYGMALIVRGEMIGSRQVKMLPSARRSIGMYARVKGHKIFAASVHNAKNVASGNEQDLAALYDWLRAKDGPVISAGDYNAFLGQPGVTRLKSYFTDADHADNEITFIPYGGRKIDYILTSPHFTGATGDTYPTPVSDHRLYLGAAWL